MKASQGVFDFELQVRPERWLRIQRGDITRVKVDAVVNAANERMLGGGGVDGAIHRAAGPALLAACRAVPEVRPNVRCPTGEARVTPGFLLPARYVIHTVGPVYRSAVQAEPLLAAAFRSSLRAASELGLQSVALPAVSCGVYGYPVQEAAEIALSVCLEPSHDVADVRFVLLDPVALDAWLRAARALVRR